MCSEVVSNCCGALIYEDTDICSECLEHCDKFREDEEFRS